VGARMAAQICQSVKSGFFFFWGVVVVGDEPIKEVYHEKKKKMSSPPLSKLINMNHTIVTQ
jgi:hypothetical protein